jgi:uncharacterized protein
MACLPGMISCYRGAEKLSTRISLIVLAIALAGAPVATRPPVFAAQPDPAAVLPPGALKGAASLYLREAASSPVRWQRWGTASLSLAKSLKRPILLDIGAVWCHWCHVMDQGTYADPRVADLINRSFVPIKVDTDERPDIDDYYQRAAEVFGVGGWPLTCFVTADGAPMLIVGYIPPATSQQDPHGIGMTDLLGRVADGYASDPEVVKTAHTIAAKLAAGEAPAATGTHGDAEALRVAILHSISATYDPINGGFGPLPGPKFYDFQALRLALAHGFHGHPEFTAIALDSLRKIAAGGVYDQLGGGFHRYSTDPNWRVPHFEKMGYDQALAIQTYTEAYVFSLNDENFARVARGVVGYVNSALLDPKTLTFYSHQDADAFPGDDGSYYTWTNAELEQVLKPDEARVAVLYLGFDPDPARAPDGRVVLRRAMTPDAIAAQLKLRRADVDATLTHAVAAMVAARDRRPVPKVDHTVLIDRNALMATAYLYAAPVLRDDALQKIALDDLDFLLAHARAADGSFYHAWAYSKAEVPGLVEDQVRMLEAMNAAYRATATPRYLDEARALAALIMKRFCDPVSGLLQDRETADAGTVLAAVKADPSVLFDQTMPSVQASAAMALKDLAALTKNNRYDQQATKLLDSAVARANPDAGLAATLGLALEQRAHAGADAALARGFSKFGGKP